MSPNRGGWVVSADRAWRISTDALTASDGVFPAMQLDELTLSLLGATINLFRVAQVAKTGLPLVDAASLLGMGREVVHFLGIGG